MREAGTGRQGKLHGAAAGCTPSTCVCVFTPAVALQPSPAPHLLEVPIGGKALQALHHAGPQRQRARALSILQPRVAQRVRRPDALGGVALQHCLEQVAGRGRHLWGRAGREGAEGEAW